jgi:hypothetical protein
MAEVSGRRPWERIVGREGTKAYYAFVRYRDMGESRTLRAVAKELGIPPTTSIRIR